MALGGVAFSMNIHAITPYMYASALWVGGLVMVGYWATLACDGADITADTHVRIAESPSITAGPDICWPSLAEAEMAGVSLKMRVVNPPHSMWRGSLISHGRTFVIQQDDAGHLIRQPLDAERTLGKDLSKKKTGQTHDTASTQGNDGSIANIRLCDGNDAVNIAERSATGA